MARAPLACRSLRVTPVSPWQAVSGPKNEDKTQGEVAGILKNLGFTSDMVYKF